MNLCKLCKQPVEEHAQIGVKNPNNANIPFSENWCPQSTSTACIFTPMDNLDYIEFLAKEQNLI